MAKSEFLGVIIPSFITGLIFFLLFCALRGSWAVIYAPRATWLRQTYRAPVLPRGLFAWVPALLDVEERFVVQHVSMDAAVMLRTLRMGVRVAAFATVVCCGMLIPVYATASGGLSGFEAIALSNVPETDSRLWAAVAAMWLVSFFAYYELADTYTQLLPMALAYKSREQKRENAFTVLVSGIPVAARSDEAVREYFARLYGADLVDATIAVDSDALAKKVDELRESMAALAHAQAEVQNNLRLSDPAKRNERPLHGPGKCGFMPCADKVDAVTFFTERVREQRAEVERLRGEKLAPACSAFVTFRSRTVAAAAAQTLHAVVPGAWLCQAAPEPREVQWTGVNMPPERKSAQARVVAALTTALVLLWVVPVSFISSVSNLDRICREIDLSCDFDPTAKSIIQGLLPTVLLIVLMALLPIVLRLFAIAEGAVSLSDIDGSVAGKYYAFLVFNVFLVVTLSGSVFNALDEITSDPSSIIEILGRSVPSQALFFAQFIALRALGEAPSELARIGPLVVGWLKLRYLALTEHERLEAVEPGSPDFASLYPTQMLIFTIFLCYACIQPIVAPFALLYFGLSFLVWKHQLLMVYTPAYDTGGRVWPQVFRFAVAALMIAQLTLLGMLGIKQAAVGAPLLVPLPILTYFFSSYFSGRYTRFLAAPDLPREAAAEADAAYPVDAVVIARTHEGYRAPALAANLDQLLDLAAPRHRGRHSLAPDEIVRLEDEALGPVASLAPSDSHQPLARAADSENGGEK
jgi:hypothetical protein